ncbi:hypothetical protein FB451DRAFT_1219594 [Mycena latifolia]|nr:hypothetical protein FB451DRAFT_1219594 [Mycena latifolia]
MAEESHLPTFLVPFGEPAKSPPYYQAVFNHSTLGPAHSLWWNSTQHEESPEAIFLFIPGNPGLVNFYIEFLNSLHAKHPGLAIFAHAHLAHTPEIHAMKSEGPNGLVAQIQSAIEALDSVRAAFPETKVIIGGHSIGAWVALQVMKARPSDVHKAFMLCPTLTHMADTPNGRRLKWLFRPPFPRIVSYISYLTRPLPLSLFFPDWPFPQLAVLRSFLNSPATIFACMSMAHEEMLTVRELDTPLLEEHRHRIYLYFAKEDEWVSTHKATIVRSFLAVEATRVVEADVPHAFCIKHSEEAASQCSAWLGALGS